MNFICFAFRQFSDSLFRILNQNSDMSITDRGQVTIPKSMRERFGFTPDTEVEFVEVNHQLVLRKLRPAAGRGVRRVFGLLRAQGEKTDTLIEGMRGR